MFVAREKKRPQSQQLLVAIDCLVGTWTTIDIQTDIRENNEKRLEMIMMMMMKKRELICLC